jgi:signal peptidase II
MRSLQRYAHLLILLPVLALDRWTKYLIETHIAFRDGWSLTSWLSIVNWHNTGGLFGFMAHNSLGGYFFLFFPILIIVGLAVYLTIYRIPLWSRLALTFVFAGALGNMYDRFAYGFVIDFIDVAYYGANHWPAFNVADSSITFGIGFWIFAQFILREGTAKAYLGDK